MKMLTEIIKQVAIISAGVMVTGGVLYLLNQGKGGTYLQGISTKITSGFGAGGQAS